MKTIFALSRQRRLRVCGVVAACAITAGTPWAQAPEARIRSEVNASQQTAIKGSLHPLAQTRNDSGRMPAGTRLGGITMYFNRSAAQDADLQTLLAAQQNPSSPLYHQWLTPEQFAARFGMAAGDLDAVQSWLQQQGFSIDSISRSRNSIRFSGTAGQVESAFQTQMHYYTANGQKHFAPSTALSVPAAIAPVIAAVRNLSDLKPRAQHVISRPGFTSGVSGSAFLAPGDIITAYDVQPLLSGGDNGAGQSIAVMGQSAIQASDIEAFESAAGLPKKDPNMVLVPGTGDSTAFTMDESESDLDVEWAGAIAQGANIVFVYTGNSNNGGVFDSLTYAIEEGIAPIISLSYSSCETEISQSELSSMEAQFQQAAAQGQTVLSASGDQGSTACSGDTALTTAQQDVIAVDYPASSAYVLGVGGTEMSSANAASSNSTYWVAASGGSDVLTSLKQYVPEVAWNDNSTQNGLSASGGGTSVLVSRPSWQTGVPGIPAGNNRLVPDVALYSSADLPGYLYCTSDTTAWQQGSVGVAPQQASCNNGFRDAATQDLTIAGGTSFATPIFAGMVAILNQKFNYPTGQGLINPTLYTLAANSTTYASAFHDVTSGNNNCTAGSSFCGSTTGGFSAGAGYDEVTGLGSVDLANLAAVWPANAGSSASLIGTMTTVAPTNATPTVNTPDTFTITVASDSGTTIPSGTVTLQIDGGASMGGTTVANQTLGPGGTVTYSATFTTGGIHQILAQYSGDSTHAASTGVGSVTIAVVSSGKGTIAVAASPATLTIAQGSQGSESVTVTPSGGYTGTVILTLDFGTSGDNLLQNLCGGFASMNNQGNGTVQVTGSGVATTQLSLDTNASDCATAAAVARTGMRPLKVLQAKGTASNAGSSPLPLTAAFAGLAFVGLLGLRSRKLFNALAVLAVLVVGLAMSACSSNSLNNAVVNPPKGTYTGTVTGQDSATASITGATTFKLVIN